MEMDLAAQSAMDEHAVAGVVRDYFESWFEGDAERMKRALHPKLAKRTLLAGSLAAGKRDVGDADPLDEDTAQTMVAATGKGIGKSRATTPEERAFEIVVEDVYDTIASVTVRSPIYHEYLHLVRTREGWKIVNALWQRTLPGSDGRR
jgi:hypothetical protein